MWHYFRVWVAIRSISSNIPLAFISFWRTRRKTLYSIGSTDAYMPQSTRPLLIQVMVCGLFIAKPLPEPVLAYCQLAHWNQFSVKFETKYDTFHYKYIKMSSIVATMSQPRCVIKRHIHTKAMEFICNMFGLFSCRIYRKILSRICSVLKLFLLNQAAFYIPRESGQFLARWRKSAGAYQIGVRNLCLSVCVSVCQTPISSFNSAPITTRLG